jgi:thiamine-phosphate pyrophosphorylase
VVPSPLQAIIDVEVAVAAGWRPADLAARCLDGGARWLQLRAKHLPDGAFLELCDVVIGLAASQGASVLVNDRADLARLAGAAGVHLGQDDLPPAAARRLLGPEAQIGWSTHTEAQVAAATAWPITYLAVGPIYGTATKDTGYAAVGLARVHETVAGAGGRPVVAIGGITLARAPEVLAAGASAVAVITDLLVGGDPAARVRAYLETLAGPPRG